MTQLCFLDFHQKKFKPAIKSSDKAGSVKSSPRPASPLSYRHVIARRQQRGPNNSGRLRVEEEKRLRLSTYPARATARVRKKVFEARREASAQEPCAPAAKSRSESAALGSVMKLYWCVCLSMCVCVCRSQILWACRWHRPP